LRPELQSYPVEKIPSDAIKEVATQAWIDEYLSRIGISMTKVSELDLIIAPAHSTYGESVTGYRGVYDSIIHTAVENGLNVAVKYHPRDHGEFLPTNKYGSVTVLPAQIPFELITMTGSVTVISDISTVLLTSAVEKNNRVYSIAPLLDHSDEELFETFTRVGVGLLSEWSCVSEVLSEEKNIASG
jgi:hypothetical protein